MNKLRIKVVFILLLLCIIGNTNILAQNSTFQQRIYEITECNDGIDNDGDGSIDYASDNGCLSWEDVSELIEITENTQAKEEPVVENVEIDNGINDGIQETLANIKNFFSNILGDLSDGNKPEDIDPNPTNINTDNSPNDNESNITADPTVVNRENVKEAKFNFLWEPLGKVLNGNNYNNDVELSKPIGMTLRAGVLAIISLGLIILRIKGKI